MPGFFLSLGGVYSFPPSGRKTPVKNRAFFGLSDPLRMESCLPPSRGPESPKGPPDLSGDPDGPVARLAATEGVSSSCLFSRVFLSFLDSFSRPAGASSLKREPSGTGDRALGREPYSALQARRRPVAWRAGSRLVFDPALIFACGGFASPCSRFPLPKQKAGPFLPDRLLEKELL